MSTHWSRVIQFWIIGKRDLARGVPFTQAYFRRVYP